GITALFVGPSGTGKTMAAEVIAHALGLDLYKIDLAGVVSKYIGETEKNLEQIFREGQDSNAILFFDEADALFGKRAAVQSSNDRHANQEIAYLLQRVEDFPGVVILASNLRGNIDEAFSRRFQSMVYFPMPDGEQRMRLWRGLLPESSRLADDIDLEALAEQHVLSGGAIVNVLRFAVLQAARSGAVQINANHLRVALAKELGKEGRTVG
ncbi:ATP-binding protein, partial [Dyella sp.]|uniref:ATP-binding protein n=1 Tax=Dyella sp. TaxID=1869338 RepID=UPI002D79CC08